VSALAVLAVALLLALATWAHYAFWTRRYLARTGEDEILFADTPDGWRLALARRRARGAARPTPVLLVHGIAANRVSLDFVLERWSLSAHLAAAGFDCFALDLRGHGLSRRARPDAPRRWTFDDHVRLDVPAALAAVRAATGAAEVHWVGHSQGGLIGMAASAAFPERIASLVALGSPAYFGAQGALKLFARFAFMFTGSLNRFAARCLVPLSGFVHPPVSQVAINTRNVSRAVYRRVIVNVVENVSTGVLRQLARWIATDTFASRDGGLDYRAALASCRQPALFVAGAGDRIAPPEVVERAARAWGGEAEVLRVGIAGAACCDYGHSDLLFGRSAPEEVFPAIAGWLAGRDEALRGASRLPLPGEEASSEEGERGRGRVA
jgi:pimeloyl-ACP methyl ester carboxylesterase